MDYIDYSDKSQGTKLFPTPVGASPSNPATLHNTHNDIVYVNTGTGWQPLVQPSSGSVYPAYTTASAAVQTAILASVTKTTSAPSAVHTAVATKTAEVAVRGR